MRLREGETCQGCTVHSRKVRVQIQACLMPIPLIAMPGRLPGGAGGAWGGEKRLQQGLQGGEVQGGEGRGRTQDPTSHRSCSSSSEGRQRDEHRPACPRYPQPSSPWAALGRAHHSPSLDES